MFPRQNYQGPNILPVEKRRCRTVNSVIHGAFHSVSAAIQLILWIAIVILEIMSIYYDAGRGTIYAGLWCSIIFFVTWVSMFCYFLCGKSGRCLRYLVVQNTINLVFVIVLLVFTSYFIKDPCLCYGALCRIPNWDFDSDIDDDDDDDHLKYSCNSRTLRKVPILKGLFGCAVLMLVCNIVFIATYLIILIRLRVRASSTVETPNVMYQQRSASVAWVDEPSHHPSNMAHSPNQPPPLYPIQDIQTTSQWPSASAPPPPYETHPEKF